ncbi:MAG TPA: hypothetical protein VGQ13_04400 [Nitrososphaera sp.]|nr:hypothetical protein [Nitrososphaera sp.]
MATIQQYRFKNGPAGLIETVYVAIRSKSGKVTSKDLDHLIGNRLDVRFAITRLTVQGRIKRIRGFGKVGIEYFYKDVASEQRRPKAVVEEQAATWY